MELPRHCIVGRRPVKLVETADGGLDCLVYDWDRGGFVRDMGYLHRAALPDAEVEVVTAAEFETAVAALERERRRRDRRGPA